MRLYDLGTKLAVCAHSYLFFMKQIGIIVQNLAQNT